MSRFAAGLTLALTLFVCTPVRAQNGGLFDEDTALRELYRLVREDFRTANALRRLEGDTAYYDTNPNAKASVPDAERRRAVALARNDLTNRLLVEVALEDLRSRSRALQERLTAASASGQVDQGAQVWDVVVVGAGIHDQVFNNVLAQENGTLRVLTVEKTDVVASNFALAGDGGRLNSTTRATNADVVPQPGRGNLNELPGGALQLPDVSATKNPAFAALADVATVNRDASKNPVLFGRGVAKVEIAAAVGGARPKADYTVNGVLYRYYGVSNGREYWIDTRTNQYTDAPPLPVPARYKVTLDSGEVVYTSSVVYATGLGTPSQPDIEASSRALLEQGERAGTAFTYEAFMRRAANERNPYRAFAGKSVVVVGTGDSAKVAIEWLLRLAPEAGYGEDSTQTGMVEKIYWVGQNEQDCKQFIQNVRVRYADVAGGIKSGMVVPVPGKLELAASMTDGKYLFTTSEGRAQRADFVVTATGYESRLEETLAPIVAKDQSGKPLGPKNPIALSNLVQEIRMAIAGRTGTPIVAKQLAGQEIYFMGAAAGTIVPVEEVANVPENLKSIYGLGPRTGAFARYLLGRFRSGNVRPVQVGATSPVRVALAVAADGTGAKVTLSGTPAPEPRRASPAPDLALEAELRGALRRGFALGAGLDDLELTFRRDAAGKVEVGFSKPLGAAGAESVRKAIDASPQLLRNLETVLGPADAANEVKLSLARESGDRLGASARIKVGRAAETPGFVSAVGGANAANAAPDPAPPTVYGRDLNAAPAPAADARGKLDAALANLGGLRPQAETLLRLPNSGDAVVRDFLRTTLAANGVAATAIDATLAAADELVRANGGARLSDLLAAAAVAPAPVDPARARAAAVLAALPQAERDRILAEVADAGFVKDVNGNSFTIDANKQRVVTLNVTPAQFQELNQAFADYRTRAPNAVLADLLAERGAARDRVR